jgi:hypothetical protein
VACIFSFVQFFTASSQDEKIYAAYSKGNTRWFPDKNAGWESHQVLKPGPHFFRDDEIGKSSIRCELSLLSPRHPGIFVAELVGTWWLSRSTKISGNHP